MTTLFLIPYFWITISQPSLIFQVGYPDTSPVEEGIFPMYQDHSAKPGNTILKLVCPQIIQKVVSFQTSSVFL